MKETASKGKFLEIAYAINVVGDGIEPTLVYEFTTDRPDRFVLGHEPGMLPAFMKNLEGLTQGDNFNFTLTAADAFGTYDPEMVKTLSRDIFMVDGEFDSERVRKGSFIPMRTADGMIIEGRVVEVNNDAVILDFNHQLAGKDINYSGTVITIRDATPEELAATTAQCGGSCGSCGDGGCSDCSGDCNC